MATEVLIETAAFQGSFSFTEAKLITQTKEAVVVALSNEAGDRVVITLAKDMLSKLGDWRMLF